MFFDVSSIPEYAIINRATLKLFYDESESIIGSSSSDYLSMILMEGYDSSEVDITYSNINLKRDTLETYYSGEITQYVQSWVSEENNGFQLYLFDEIETVNKIAIATEEHPNQLLKPYLEIIYTSKK